MGLFSKKPKENKSVPPKSKEPDLTLNYSSGTTAQINFKQGKYIDNKYVSVVDVIYIDKESRFSTKTFLLEPHLQQAEDNQFYDYTKQYYFDLINRQKENDVKGFFKEEYLTESLIGSDYIGKLEYSEEGKAFRRYDKDFKQKYISIYMENKQMKAAQIEENEKQKEEDFKKQLKEKIDNIQEHIKTSHATLLTQEDYKNQDLDR